MLGSVFGRTDFSRIFIFGPPDFFADFLAGFFLLIFVGKSGQKNPPGKSPGNPPKFIQQKSSNTFLQIAQGNECPSLGGQRLWVLEWLRFWSAGRRLVSPSVAMWGVVGMRVGPA